MFVYSLQYWIGSFLLARVGREYWVSVTTRLFNDTITRNHWIHLFCQHSFRPLGHPQSTRVRHWRRAREHRGVAHKLGGILAAWGGDGDGGGGGGGEGGGQLRSGGRDSAGRVWHRGVQQAALAAQPPISSTHINFALDFAYLRGGNIFQNRNQARPQSGRAIWKN